MTRTQAAGRLHTLEARIVAMVQSFTSVALTTPDTRLRQDFQDAAYDLTSAADKVAYARRYLDRKVLT
jgi:hypothetical protein